MNTFAPKSAHPLEPLNDLIGLQLRLAQLRFFDDFFLRFGEIGVTPAEHAILAIAAASPGIRQGELGRLLSIKKSNMTKTMRALERRKLAVRIPAADDARAFEVYPTASGRKIQEVLNAHVYEVDRQSAAQLTDSESRQLLALLKKLNAPAKENAEIAKRRELVDG